tara:strand:+ start:1035 stop:2315 length:1281 start_codon:yes stop_codon:yes gene_type:complete
MSALNFTSSNIAVIGMGYVGLPLAVEFGKKWNTVGFDIDQRRIEDLRNQVDHTNETSLEDLRSAKYLQYSFKLEALQKCNIYIICVPTPIDKNNNPDLSAIKNATRLISDVIKKGDLVIYESTVYPGLTEEVCIPIIESNGMKLNHDFYCGYSPERINPGDKSHRLQDIIKIVSGSNLEALNMVDELYSSIINAGVHRATSIKVAEAAKVIENTQRDLNIALVNELSIIFHSMNIDTNEILEAANTKWNFNLFKPGLVGGHCIGVDPYYLTFKSEKLGYTPQIILAGRKLNNEMPAYIAEKFNAEISSLNVSASEAKILILGFSFKENCPDIRNTKVIDLYHRLVELGMQPDIYDANVNSEEVLKEYNISLKNSLEKDYYHGVILAVPHNNFLQWGPDKIRALCNEEHIFFDLKAAFDIKDSEFRL